jgi:hypothetical protein
MFRRLGASGFTETPISIYRRWKRRMAKKVKQEDLINLVHWIEDQYWPSFAHGSVKEVRNKIVTDFKLPMKQL